MLHDANFRSVVSDLLADLKCPQVVKASGQKPTAYNKQWRHYDSSGTNESAVDQIDWLIKILKEKPHDRRKLLVAWNPAELEKGMNELRHCLIQFHVNDGRLSCKLYQNRANIQSVLDYDCVRSVILTYILCQATNLLPGSFIHCFGELDFTVDNLAMLGENVGFARCTILAPADGIFDVGRLKLDDFYCKSEAIESVKFQWEMPCYPGEIISHIDGASVASEEHQYLHLVRRIIDTGTSLPDRTGCGTRSIFGPKMTFSLSDGVLPLLTTKRVFHRGIIEELLWFIRGCTDGADLARRKVHIWDANGSAEFLASVGLGHRRPGDLGPIYGFQWRHFGAKYIDADTNYSNEGLDQLGRAIAALKSSESDKSNIVVVAWNPSDLPLMALPPCHCLMQFMVEPHDQSLSCQLYQRSADMGLGVPFNIASYAILTHMVAHVTGRKPGRLYHSFGDAHVYLNHIEPLLQQLKREPRPFPTLRFKRKLMQLEDFQFDDFIIENYNPHEKISMDMAV